MEPWIDPLLQVGIPLAVAVGVLLWAKRRGGRHTLWIAAAATALAFLALLYLQHRQYVRPDGPFTLSLPLGVLPVVGMAGVVDLTARTRWPQAVVAGVAWLVGAAIAVACGLWAYANL